MLQLSLKIRDIPEAGPEAGDRLDVVLDRVFLRDALGPEIDLTRSHVTVHAGVGMTDDVVQVRGRLEGEIWSTCVRCLGEARTPVDVPLHIILGPEDLGAEETADVVAETPEDEIEYYTHDDNTVELAVPVRESLILGLPMNLLCRPDCQGLCVSCGVPRDPEGKLACGCPEKAPDPRWSALKDLKI